MLAEPAALITNNPDKLVALARCSVEPRGRIALPSAVNIHNTRCLRTKRDKLRHSILLA
jgi:GTP cyclohydrolase II